MTTPQVTIRGKSRPADRIFSTSTIVAGSLILAALAAVAIFLLVQSIPALLADPAELKGEPSSFWAYVAPLIFGTVWAAFLALLFALPLSIGIALFISHYAPRRVAQGLGYIIDLLAAVPSVVFGLWGIKVLAPMVQPLYAWLNQNLGWIPLFSELSGTRAHDPDRRHRARGHDHPDHHGDQPGGVPADAGPARRSSARARCNALGDDQDRGAALRPPRHHLGGDARPRPRTRRDHGGRHGALPAVVITFVLTGSINPSTIAGNIALNFPEAHGIGVNALIATGLILFLITLAINSIARFVINRRKAFSGAN